MTTAKKLGRIAYQSGPEKCDKLKDLYVRETEADVKRVESMCELKMKVSSEEEKNARAEPRFRDFFRAGVPLLCGVWGV